MFSKVSLSKNVGKSQKDMTEIERLVLLDT